MAFNGLYLIRIENTFTQNNYTDTRGEAAGYQGQI